MTRFSVKWPLTGILSGVVILASGVVPSEARFGRAPLVRLQEELGLSDDQVRAIHEIHSRQWESRRQLMRALHNARRSLRELVLKGGDEAAIQVKTAEVQQLIAQTVERRVKALQELSQILTPEQRDKLLQLRPDGRRGGLPLAG